MTITSNYVVRMINQTKSYKINLSLSALNLFILSFSKLSEPSVRLLGHVLLGVPGWVCQVQVVACQVGIFLDQWINGLTTHKFIFRDSTGTL